MDNDRSAEPTISGIGTTARALANVTTSDWWRRRHTGLSASYRKWELGYAIAEPPELRLPRTSLHRLLAPERHMATCAVSQKFGHSDAELNCLCGYKKTLSILYSVRSPSASSTPGRRSQTARPAAPEEGRKYLNVIMAHPELFENFLIVTQYFTLNARESQTRDRTSSGDPQ
ncbi:hypothetical protein DID88_001599 [Monilinia fructigena]|uniref:Uncharacterized protein n=1 Tax=Monilinia fructigena TaxID=38457 RepID=A0A395IYS2_9HELO|nr:hypothetical protein DID88_001599 [Monilinia fructigena]